MSLSSDETNNGMTSSSYSVATEREYNRKSSGRSFGGEHNGDSASGISPPPAVQVAVRVQPLSDEELIHDSNCVTVHDNNTVRVTTTPTTSTVTGQSHQSQPLYNTSGSKKKVSTPTVYTFDRVFHGTNLEETEQVFIDMIEPIIDDSCGTKSSNTTSSSTGSSTNTNTNNVSILVYGDKGSGKTSCLINSQYGFIPRSLIRLFRGMSYKKAKEIRETSNDVYDYEIRIQVVEIINKNIIDLLGDNNNNDNNDILPVLSTCESVASSSKYGGGATVKTSHTMKTSGGNTTTIAAPSLSHHRSNITLRGWDKNGSPKLEGSVQEVVTSIDDAMICLEHAFQRRNTTMVGGGGGHTIVSIIISQTIGEEVINSTINFVDLASPQHQKQQQQQQAEFDQQYQQPQTLGMIIPKAIHLFRTRCDINQSLLVLGIVLTAIWAERKYKVDFKHITSIPFIPYRDSLLTSVLKGSLSGTSKTLFIACITSSLQQNDQTIDILRFANRIKSLKPNPNVLLLPNNDNNAQQQVDDDSLSNLLGDKPPAKERYTSPHHQRRTETKKTSAIKAKIDAENKKKQVLSPSKVRKEYPSPLRSSSPIHSVKETTKATAIARKNANTIVDLSSKSSSSVKSKRTYKNQVSSKLDVTTTTTRPASTPKSRAVTPTARGGRKQTTTTASTLASKPYTTSINNKTKNRITKATAKKSTTFANSAVSKKEKKPTITPATKQAVVATTTTSAASNFEDQDFTEMSDLLDALLDPMESSKHFNTESTNQMSGLLDALLLDDGGSVSERSLPSQRNSASSSGIANMLSSLDDKKSDHTISFDLSYTMRPTDMMDDLLGVNLIDVNGASATITTSTTSLLNNNINININKSYISESESEALSPTTSEHISTTINKPIENTEQLKSHLNDLNTGVNITTTDDVQDVTPVATVEDHVDDVATEQSTVPLTTENDQSIPTASKHDETELPSDSVPNQQSIIATSEGTTFIPNENDNLPPEAADDTIVPMESTNDSIEADDGNDDDVDDLLDQLLDDDDDHHDVVVDDTNLPEEESPSEPAVTYSDAVPEPQNVTEDVFDGEVNGETVKEASAVATDSNENTNDEATTEQEALDNTTTSENPLSSAIPTTDKVPETAALSGGSVHTTADTVVTASSESVTVTEKFPPTDASVSCESTAATTTADSMTSVQESLASSDTASASTKSAESSRFPGPYRIGNTILNAEELPEPGVDAQVSRKNMLLTRSALQGALEKSNDSVSSGSKLVVSHIPYLPINNKELTRVLKASGLVLNEYCDFALPSKKFPKDELETLADDDKPLHQSNQLHRLVGLWACDWKDPVERQALLVALSEHYSFDGDDKLSSVSESAESSVTVASEANTASTVLGQENLDIKDSSSITSGSALEKDKTETALLHTPSIDETKPSPSVVPSDNNADGNNVASPMRTEPEKDVLMHPVPVTPDTIDKNNAIPKQIPNDTQSPEPKKSNVKRMDSGSDPCFLPQRKVPVQTDTTTKQTISIADSSHNSLSGAPHITELGETASRGSNSISQSAKTELHENKGKDNNYYASETLSESAEKESMDGDEKVRRREKGKKKDKKQKSPRPTKQDLQLNVDNLNHDIVDAATDEFAVVAPLHHMEERKSRKKERSEDARKEKSQGSVKQDLALNIITNDPWIPDNHWNRDDVAAFAAKQKTDFAVVTPQHHTSERKSSRKKERSEDAPTPVTPQHHTSERKSSRKKERVEEAPAPVRQEAAVTHQDAAKQEKKKKKKEQQSIDPVDALIQKAKAREAASAAAPESSRQVTKASDEQNDSAKKKSGIGKFLKGFMKR